MMKSNKIALFVLWFITVLSSSSLYGKHSELEVHLTGVWDCDDGGTYYSRLVDRDFYWYGESPDGGKAWTNIFVGRLIGRSIKGEWLDLPKGHNSGKGSFKLKISDDNLSLVLVDGGNGFGGRLWKRRLK